MVILLFLLVIIATVGFNYGKIWVQAYFSRANVTLMSLIGMSFRRVNKQVIVTGKIMAMQAGIGQESGNGHHHPAAGGPLPGRRQRARR